MKHFEEFKEQIVRATNNAAQKIDEDWEACVLEGEALALTPRGCPNGIDVAAADLKSLYDCFSAEMKKANVYWSDLPSSPSGDAEEDENSLKLNAMMVYLANRVANDLYRINKDRLEKGNLKVETEEGKITDLLEKVEILLVSTKKNELTLPPDAVLCEIGGDLAVAYCYVKEKLEAGFISSVVTESDLKNAEVTRKQLHEAAMKNTQKAYPEKLEKLDTGLYIVGTDASPCPAAAILYPGVMKTLADRLGANLLVYPIAVNLVYVVDESRALHSDIGGAVCLPISPDQGKELSNYMFRYDRAENKFEALGFCVKPTNNANDIDLSYEEFKPLMIKELGSVLDFAQSIGVVKENLVLKFDSVQKKGKMLDAVRLFPKDSDGSEAILQLYINNMYEELLEVARSIPLGNEEEEIEMVMAVTSKIAVDSIKTLLEASENHPFMDVDMEALAEEVTSKDKLLAGVELQLFEAGDGNAPEGIPCYMIGDMAAAYSYVVKKDENGESFSVTITSDFLKEAGVTHEQLHEAAMKNTQEKFPATIETLSEGTCMIYAEGAHCPATAMLYNGLLHTLADRMQSDLLIVPQSTERVFVTSEEFAMSEVKRTGAAVINAQLSGEVGEPITKNMLKYDRNEGRLHVVGKSLGEVRIPPGFPGLM